MKLKAAQTAHVSHAIIIISRFQYDLVSWNKFLFSTCHCYECYQEYQMNTTSYHCCQNFTSIQFQLQGCATRIVSISNSTMHFFGKIPPIKAWGTLTEQMDSVTGFLNPSLYFGRDKPRPFLRLAANFSD